MCSVMMVTTVTKNIAVLGIGLMGLPTARRLREAGHDVRAWNRTRSKAERLLPFGVTVCDSPQEAVQGAEVVVCFLENGEVSEHVLFALSAAAAMQPGTLVIDMASTKPREAREHAARLASMGIAHLDCPVSGGTLGAESGSLVIMVGGQAADFARAQPLLSVMGTSTHIGTHGTGQLAKLANQMIVGITIGAVAEAFLLCERGGANVAKVREAISGGFADSRILQLHGQRMVQRDFTARGRLAIQLKDMRNALDTAAESSMDTPITLLLEKLYADAHEHGLGELDHSGLFVEMAARNGMH
jgi:3-hydroxyisobutyrate dehydrogenase-like beta-hydroxyacid dehydrogenase